MWHVWERGEVRTGFWWGKREGRPLENLVADGGIILKWIFKTWDERRMDWIVLAEGR